MFSRFAPALAASSNAAGRRRRLLIWPVSRECIPPGSSARSSTTMGQWRACPTSFGSAGSTASSWLPSRIWRATDWTWILKHLSPRSMGCCPFLQHTHRSRQHDLSPQTYVSPAKRTNKNNRLKPQLHTDKHELANKTEYDRNTDTQIKAPGSSQSRGPPLVLSGRKRWSHCISKSRRLGQKGHRNCSRPNPRWNRGGCRSWPHLLDQHGQSHQERWLHRTHGPGRKESHHDHSRGSDIHAKAAPSREGERQVILVRSRGDARHALESRRFENRTPRGYQWRRSASRP